MRSEVTLPVVGREHARLVWSRRETSGIPGAGVARDGPLRLSCIVPALNEAANLALLLPRLKTVLAHCAAQWEVIVVDDGSRDGTDVLLEAWSREPGFVGIVLSRNFGKEAALMAGLEAATGDVVLTMDADFQHPPETIPSLVEAWRCGAAVAYAARSDRSADSPARRWAARGFYRLLNAAHRFEVPADAGDFRLMDRQVVDALLALPERNRFMKGLYAWVGFDAVAVPYRVAPRLHGASRFGWRQLTRLSMAGLTAFTTWPLRAVSATGAALALCAIGYALWLSADYLVHGHQVSGWTTIIVAVLFLSGVQLISLGVVGEYVGRVFEEVKQRPLFVVARRLGTGLAARQAARAP